MYTPPPKLDPLTAVVLHFADRLLLVFAYPMFFVEFRKELPLLKNPGLSNRGLHILPTIRSACLCSTLMALRDIDDVLAPRTEETRKDALRACDIGFPEVSRFLTSAERRDINTIIVHSTKWAARTEGKNSLDIEELITKGIAQGMGFLAWVKTSYPPQKNSRAWAAADFYLKETGLIVRHLKKVKDRQVALDGSRCSSTSR